MTKKKKTVKVRRLWKIKPVTKVKDSDKRYNRRKAKEEFYKEWQDK